MTWLAAVPTFLLFGVVLYVPGWLMLRLLGVRGIVGWAAAPAPVVAIAVLTGEIYRRLGVPWSLLTLTVSLLVGVAVAWVIAWGTGRRSPLRVIGALPVSQRDALLIGVGLVVGLALQSWAYLPGMGAPDALHQIHDAVFHLNATEAIVRTGDASGFGVLTTPGAPRRGVFYPIAWNAIAALGATTASTVAAVNVFMLFMVLVIWPVGIAALARVVAPTRPVVAAAAPVIAASFIIYPVDSVVMQGAFPYGLAIAVAPGAAALIIATLDPRVGGPGSAATAVRTVAASWLVPLVIIALAAAGVAATHPTGAAVLGILLLPKLIEIAARKGRALMSAGRRTAGWLVVLALPAVVLLVLASLFVVPPLRSMTAYPAPDGSRREALIRGFLTSTEPIGWTSQWANLVVAAMLVIGLVVALIGRRTRWFGFTWLLALAVYVVASGPDSFLRDLTGFWYESGERTQSMLVTLTAVMAGLGVAATASAFAGWVQSAANRRDDAASPPPDRRWVLTTLTAVTILLVAYLTSGQFRRAEQEGWTAWGFRTEEIIHGPYVTDDEYAMIRSLPEVVPPDAVILGDPFSGAPFVQGIAGLRAYIPALNPVAWDANQKYLMAHFDQIHTDPRVCDIVRDGGIAYFYWDVDNGAGWGPQKPGLYNADTSDGFELVAAADTARVYRITACG